jgi:hypothetical protein
LAVFDEQFSVIGTLECLIDDAGDSVAIHARALEKKTVGGIQIGHAALLLRAVLLDLGRVSPGNPRKPINIKTMLNMGGKGYQVTKYYRQTKKIIAYPGAQFPRDRQHLCKSGNTLMSINCLR